MATFELPSEAATTTNTTTTTSTTSDISDDDDLSTLPLPQALSRTEFLAPNFNPHSYLTSLNPRSRHQTLEDLRTDLRQRSQQLNQELLDLVNSNYESFLDLGQSLRGGEEKVESVRVGGLGFEREIEQVRKQVEERRNELGGLLGERRGVRRDVQVGRALLEVHEGLRELEERLGIVDVEGEEEDEEDEEEDEEDEDEDDEEGSPEDVRLRRLERHVQLYVLLRRQEERVGKHPFLEAQQSRFAEVRKTLLLDLAGALRHAKAQRQDPERVLKIVKLYGQMDAEGEAVRILKAG
ncbi:hypothetical protein KC318_g12322 [Hortaea werneckii]|uniref:Conserved oligomeric Golgi complex subunit 2 n=1 Tax=Hortaea werneckii TaxID=91943 RepID=A0A3M6WTZ1_HORWE|nr:hypothetical protein KC334_g12539 [Hortaea werneckii]KAI6947716.1 hypothetical protein KC355_g14792 [Hortaea werneckii]KAI7656588.1 hypothetical protein KC318_g12322 [Hortaea werneckii]RMX82042.1 hypothetical protein D0868_15884 [Hortaea werneckii]RMX85837.1 hypothetical protein D0867_15831 [Hortaea werneckii]